MLRLRCAVGDGAAVRVAVARFPGGAARHGGQHVRSWSRQRSSALRLTHVPASVRSAIGRAARAANRRRGRAGAGANQAPAACSVATLLDKFCAPEVGGHASGRAWCTRLRCAVQVMEGESAYQCDACGEKQTAVRQSRLSQLPEVLVLHLARAFWTRDGRFGKIQAAVSFPSTLNVRVRGAGGVARCRRAPDAPAAGVLG